MAEFSYDDDVQPEEKYNPFAVASTLVNVLETSTAVVPYERQPHNPFAVPSTAENVLETSTAVVPHELQPPTQKCTRFALPLTPEEYLQTSKGVLH